MRVPLSSQEKESERVRLVELSTNLEAFEENQREVNKETRRVRKDSKKSIKECCEMIQEGRKVEIPCTEYYDHDSDSVSIISDKDGKVLAQREPTDEERQLSLA
jgi:hypothetical protein